MYHESLDILIQRRFSKLFFINEFDPTGSWQSFLVGVRPPGDFFFCKLYVCITKSEEKHS